MGLDLKDICAGIINRKRVEINSGGVDPLDSVKLPDLESCIKVILLLECHPEMLDCFLSVVLSLVDVA